MSLKRHPALQPFSRDHVVGLFHAHQLMWLSEGRARNDKITTVANFHEAWNKEIANHFEEEELLLSQLGIKIESKNKLLFDHQEIRQMVTELVSTKDPEIEFCFQTGKKLELHIRWEEHELFPEIEKSLTIIQLKELQSLTERVDEKRKHGNCSTISRE